MTGKAYYNEIDAYCAQWLRNLIVAGHLPLGDVDERDIREVQPDDLKAYGQIHLFAGIGGFPLGLRLAGWPDDRPILTGGFPCQPWSAAGKRGGVTDDRDLWPEMARLIQGVRPRWVLGENVPGIVKQPLGLDRVLSDLEGLGYATGTASVPACAVDAPHRRERIWIVAHAASERHENGEGGVNTGRSLERPKPGTVSRNLFGSDATRTGGGQPDGQAFPLAHGTRDRDTGAATSGADRERAGSGRNQERVADPDSAGRQQVSRGAPCDEEAHGRARRDALEPDGDHVAASGGEDVADGDRGRCEVERVQEHGAVEGASGDEPDRRSSRGRRKGKDVADSKGNGRGQGHQDTTGREDGSGEEQGARPSGGGDVGNATLRDTQQLPGEGTRPRKEEGGRASGGHSRSSFTSFWSNTKPSGAAGDTSLKGLPLSEREDLRGKGGRQEGRATSEPSGSGMGDTIKGERGRGADQSERETEERTAPRRGGERGFWADHEVIAGRRVKPGVRLLAHGIPQRVAKLRAFGNAVVPQVVAEIAKAMMKGEPQ